MIMDFVDWWIERFIPIIFLLFITLIMVEIPLLVYGCFRESQSPTFELKKDDWSCSLEHEYTTSTMILVGKVMVPQMITHHDCIRWEQK